MAQPVAGNKKVISQPSFQVNKVAHKVMRQAVAGLVELEQQCAPSPLDNQFRVAYLNVLSFIDEYHSEVIRTSDYSLGCTKGCSCCCCHWVEDVNSFEGVIIADFIKKHFPNEVDRILKECQKDCDELLRLEQMVSDKLDEQKNIGNLEELPDTMELLLSVFYQMRRPCPLLSKEGTCLVYPVRPLTCRMYISVSDPIRCDPDYINDTVTPTCILDLYEEANTVLDALHVRYRGGDADDTGLRSLLVQFLQ